MREDWADKLKRKLEGHSQMPPEGLWEGISKEMEASPVSFQKGGRNWRWYAAAAAIILMLVGIFVFQEKESKPLLQAETISLEPTAPQAENIDSVKGEDKPLPNPLQGKRKSIVLRHPLSPGRATSKVFTKQETEPKPTDSVTVVKEAVAQITLESEPDSAQDIQPYKEQRIQVLPDELVVEQTSSASRPKWTIGVGASGGLLAAQNTKRLDYANWDGGSQHNDEDDNPDALNDNLSRASRAVYKDANYEAVHHLPLRFSMTLNYQLTSRFDLLSGISYTYLHSKFTVPQSYEKYYDQNLHYLGVPLGVSWRLWSNRHFQFYATGKVLLEKCLNEKPWQFSAGGSLGAEYNLTPQFGFYVEPSLGYYFNDGTLLEHYYKKHPVIFALDFGLRLHLNK